MVRSRLKLVLMLILALASFDVRCLSACAQLHPAPAVQKSDDHLPPCHRKNLPRPSEHNQDDCACLTERVPGQVAAALDYVTNPLDSVAAATIPAAVFFEAVQQAPPPIRTSPPGPPETAIFILRI
jgi:hypothetical protein